MGEDDSGSDFNVEDWTWPRESMDMNDIRITLDQGPWTIPGADQAVEELAAGLRAKGISVTVKIDRKHLSGAAAGLTIFETVLIFIGSGVATPLLNAVVADIYNAAKNWGRKRFSNKSENSRVRVLFTIVGPDGSYIVQWQIGEEGEQETVYDFEVDLYLYEVGNNRAQVISELHVLFDTEITQVEHAVENVPFCLLRRVDMKTADRVQRILENAGASISRYQRPIKRTSQQN